MLVLFFLVLWPVVEFFVAVKVAESIGVLLTVVLLILSWPVGSYVLRSEGRAAWRRLSVAVSEGRPPGREVINGALALVGGILLIIPGFVTDVLGIGLLFAPTRAFARRIIERNFRSRLIVKATGFGRRPGPDVVDSTAHDIDRTQLHG
jgi:UPF0716 protein FxsA